MVFLLTAGLTFYKFAGPGAKRGDRERGNATPQYQTPAGEEFNAYPGVRTRVLAA
jgi:hypothetical protein